jgi:hypothetical protein
MDHQKLGVWIFEIPRPPKDVGPRGPLGKDVGGSVGLSGTPASALWDMPPEGASGGNPSPEARAARLLDALVRYRDQLRQTQ